MGAKDILIKPILAKDANRLCKLYHYSGKVVPNSQLHFGVFYKDNCEGVMQFGPSMKKKVTINLVKGTKWNGFIELNRMAFSDRLPRYSESRAIGVAHKIIKKNYPHIDWIISFADATQCGDGAIYRASGYKLLSIKKNTTMWKNTVTGEVMQDMQFYHKMIKKNNDWKRIPGHMLKYIYFLNKKVESNLTVAPLPYEKIYEMGVGMYKGNKKCYLASEA